MTVPLWCLVALVLWTVGLVVALSAARLRYLAAGGSHRDFGIPDDRRLVWRLYRAHMNALENLPLFASVVLVAAVRGVVAPGRDALAVVYLLARLAQSTVHVAPGAGLRWNARFVFLVVQLVCLVGLAAVAVAPL
jgi:uncharacterized MAPEG superfamily protein